MKCVIAGSTTLSPTLDEIQEAVDLSGFNITEVVCGMACGVDESGRQWAIRNGIKLTPFPALWDNIDPKVEPVRLARNKYGKLYNKLAGFNRNLRMAEYGDGLIAIWTGRTPGTRNMIMHIDKLCKPRYTVIREV